MSSHALASASGACMGGAVLSIWPMEQSILAAGVWLVLAVLMAALAARGM